MKKLCLFLSACFILPFSVFAEENINNGELSSPIGTVSVYAGIESDTQAEVQRLNPWTTSGVLDVFFLIFYLPPGYIAQGRIFSC